MLRSPKRITRKDIRQPDHFVILARQCISFFTQHRTRFAVSLSILAAIVVILFGWDLYRGRQNRLAAAEYTRAVRLYHQGRYRETLQALGRLSAYPSSFYSRLALLYAAKSHMALEENEKAVEPLRQLLATERSDPLLRQAAFMSLAYVEEKIGQCQQAVLAFAEAERIAGPLTTDATLGKARCSAQTGNVNEAVASYRKFLTDNPSSERVGEMQLRLQELGGRLAGESGPRK